MDQPATGQTSMLRLSMNDLDWMTAVLTAAFLTQPPATHLFLGHARRRQTEYFMRCSCAYALLFGECHADPDRRGVALWLLPGQTAMTLSRMRKAGMLAAPWQMGLGGFSRFMAFAGHTDKLHQAAAPMPHYYLFALGVHPSAQGSGVGGRLVRGMLERVDRERMPVYLETQEARNVALYRRLGFEVAVEGGFPRLAGLHNWGMLRRAGAG